MSIFGIKFGKSDESKKEPFPAEYQVQVAMNMFEPNKLQEMKEKYILEANHWNLMGNSFRNYEKYTLAEDAYKKAIELDPENEEPYGNLLSLYILTDNYDNYENIYSAGMKNANPRSFIVFQDGRYQYHKGKYSMAHGAALSVLTAKQMQDEGAWILGVRALMGMGDNEKDEDKSLEHYSEAIDMLEKGLYIFPDSKELNRIKAIFDAKE